VDYHRCAIYINHFYYILIMADWYLLEPLKERYKKLRSISFMLFAILVLEWLVGFYTQLNPRNEFGISVVIRVAVVVPVWLIWVLATRKKKEKKNYSDTQSYLQQPIQNAILTSENKTAKEDKWRPKSEPVSDVSLQIKNDFDENEAPSVIKVHADTPEADEETFGDYDPKQDLSKYQYPPVYLLKMCNIEKPVQTQEELEENKNQIIATLQRYGITTKHISAMIEPAITLYEITPAQDTSMRRIKNLQEDITQNSAGRGIRITAPTLGKEYISIEMPNSSPSFVGLHELFESEEFQNSNYALPLALGKSYKNHIVDLVNMPHLLIAGATGQGKSVCIHNIIISLLFKKHPSQLKFVLVDSKKSELGLYESIERCFLAKLPGEEEPVITDTKKVIATLSALCIEMDNRYDLLKEAGCRNIKEYNEKFIKRKLSPKKGHQFLPFIVLVIDEFADLIMTAGKEIEAPIARLIQQAHLIGIHLIIGTQRPTSNIITNAIKASILTRIAFKVFSKTDSRSILDTNGAEQLIGNGDMLMSYNGELTRLQCAFVDIFDVEGVCKFISKQQSYPEAFMLPEYVDEKYLEDKVVDIADRDPLFEEAARLVVLNQMGSTSLIQRRMKLGYNRAGKLMDQLEMAGIVGENKGSKARDVLLKTEVELNELLDSLG
jgi:S-DNA-T family DNA segregation ATPase FtsK/SpoIIIE